MMTPLGKRALVYAFEPMRTNMKIPSDAEIDAAIQRLKANPGKVKELSDQGIQVALGEKYEPGKFSRKIDMSINGAMYGFKKEKYDLVLWFNPRTAPDFVQDRLGSNGEGLTDKKYLVETNEPYPWIDHKNPQKTVRMIRVTIPLTREQILGDKEEVIAEG